MSFFWWELGAVQILFMFSLQAAYMLILVDAIVHYDLLWSYMPLFTSVLFFSHLYLVLPTVWQFFLLAFFLSDPGNSCWWKPSGQDYNIDPSRRSRSLLSFKSFFAYDIHIRIVRIYGVHCYGVSLNSMRKTADLINSAQNLVFWLQKILLATNFKKSKT